MARRISQAPDRGAALDTDRVPIYRASLGSVEGVVQVSALRVISPSHILQSGATVGQVLKWNGTAWAPGTDNTGGGGGGGTFTGLDDTPASYTSAGGFFVAVNAGATALEFLSPASVLSAIAAAPASHTHAISDVTGLQTALDGKAATSHTHAISDVTGLQTALDGKVGTARQVATQHSLQGGGDLSADRTLSLVGDTASPGNNKVYGTDGSGNRGWKDDPAGGGGSSTFTGLSDTPANYTSAGGYFVRVNVGETALEFRAPADVRSDIGAAASTHTHPYSDLTSIPAAVDAIDGLTPAADRLAYYTGASTAALATFTSFGRSLVDDADAATGRTTLGLGSLATLNTVGTAQIDNDAVTYAKLQNVSATSRVLGRITAGAGDAEELTTAQLTTLVDTFTTSLKGAVPASGGGTTNFLRADGSWAAPSGGGGGGGPAPLYQAGTWISPPLDGSGTAVGTQTVAAGRLYLSPLPIFASVNISALAIRIVTGSTGNARMGLYTYSGGTFTRVEQIASEISTGTAGIITADLGANYSAAAGLLWIGALFSATPSVLGWNPGSGLGGGFQVWSGAGNPPGSTEFSSGNGVASLYIDQTYSSGLPASVSLASMTRSSSAPGSPYMMGRVAP